MAKIGRNDPCPCNSGKKYKKCCERIAAAQPATDLSMPPLDFDDDDFHRLSNSVVDLIEQKRFDEASAACERLHAQYPDLIEWLDRSAMLHEARGELALACDFYRRALAYTESPDQRDCFDELGRDYYRTTIAKLQSQLLSQ